RRLISPRLSRARRDSLCRAPRRQPPSFPTRRSSDFVQLTRAREDNPHLRVVFAARFQNRKLCPAVDLQIGEGIVHRIEMTGLPQIEEHTSELQSRENLVCRLPLEKKKTKATSAPSHK